MNRLTYRHAAITDLPFIIGLIIEDSVVATIDAPDAAYPGYAAALAAIDADPNQEMLIQNSMASRSAASSSATFPASCARACGVPRSKRCMSAPTGAMPASAPR
jgi:hypothetical protein